MVSGITYINNGIIAEVHQRRGKRSKLAQLQKWDAIYLQERLNSLRNNILKWGAKQRMENMSQQASSHQA